MSEMMLWLLLLNVEVMKKKEMKEKQTDLEKN